MYQSDKLSISCWIGNAHNHKALVSKIHEKFGVDSIIIDNKTRISKKNKKKSLFNKIINKIRFNSIDNAWNKMQSVMKRQYTQLPNVPTLETESINSKLSRKFIKQHHPDLVIVSGTSLIKKAMLSISPELGILNIHTGLSPYVKGGPNCTNWCIANATPELLENSLYVGIPAKKIRDF